MGEVAGKRCLLEGRFRRGPDEFCAPERGWLELTGSDRALNPTELSTSKPGCLGDHRLVCRRVPVMETRQEEAETRVRTHADAEGGTTSKRK